MINRSLIRLKIVQLLYAFSQNEGKDPETAYKELDFSLEKTQDLYHYLLSTLLELRKLAATRDNVRLARARRTGIASENASADALFAANRCIEKLGANQEMMDFLENKKQEWSEEPAFIKNLYEEILDSDDFNIRPTKGAQFPRRQRTRPENLPPKHRGQRQSLRNP